MLTPLPITAGIVGTLLLIFILVVVTRPAQFTLKRSVAIAAAPAVPFALVNDFHLWSQWSPWEKLEPGMKRTYGGSPSGVGALYGWSGNKKAGEGRMTLLESKPGELIRIKIEFIKPFPATNTVEFTFTPDTGGTAVTWSMCGTRNFMMKAFSLIMDMEKLVGPDFEKGLAQLKAIAECQPQTVA